MAGGVLRELGAVDERRPLRIDVAAHVGARPQEVEAVLPGPAVEEGVVQRDPETGVGLEGVCQTETARPGHLGDGEHPVA